LVVCGAVLLFHPNMVSVFLGITLISAVSFWDDIKSLPNKIRIIIHFLSITCVFYGLGIYSTLPWPLIFAAYIFFASINGITGLYSLIHQFKGN
jgi:UDP-N-acetylmuramyl pentapeptide phosphotransferase/UDP-N-acetylglucosamine-1-phosphate transferase